MPAADESDPLRHHRDLFVGAETDLVYLDGNSLGRPLRVTGERLRDFVELTWGDRLIRGWDEGWFDLPRTVGDELGRVVLGAAPGQTAVGDSTTVLLYKAIRAGVAAHGPEAGRTEIVLSRDDFPTDRYLAAGVARECGLTLRWIEVDPAGGVGADQLAAAVGPRTALVLLSHVAYRSAYLADAEALTRIAHDAGALVLWDLSHSVGSVPLELDRWGVDLAVGCTYKYLNGGPGSPAFVYVAARHLGDGEGGPPRLTQPIQGWMGATDPFLMGPDYAPAAGIQGFLSGTPPVLGMQPLRDMVALVDEVGMTAVREKSVGLTEHAIAVAADLLPEAALASPRDPARRGGHVTLTHPRMREVVAALWARDVVPDYRDPGGLRLGLSPLSTSYDEVTRGLQAVREVLDGLPG